MLENFKKAVEFSQKIKNINGIIAIALFGSVARGEDTRKSDIDVAVIHDLKDDTRLRKEASRLKDEDIQLIFINIKNLPKESEIVGALCGDGLILHGRPVEISENKLGIIPKVLISYSLTNLDQKEKVKVDRALYGSISISGRYRTETKGIASEAGIEKIAKGVLLADRKKTKRFLGVFKRFGVEYKIRNIWVY